MLAIIGGTGMAQLPCLEISHRKIMRTPYGEPSGPLTFGRIKDNQVVFLARHGYGHRASRIFHEAVRRRKIPCSGA